MPPAVISMATTAIPALIGGVAKSVVEGQAAKRERAWDVEDQTRFVQDDVTTGDDFGTKLTEEMKRRRNLPGPTLSSAGKPIVFKRYY